MSIPTRQEKRAQFVPSPAPVVAIPVVTNLSTPWSIVPMDEVPAPPAGSRIGKYTLMYEALREMPAGHSLRMPVEGGAKALTYMRSQLNNQAKRDGKRLLSSRDAGNTVAWFWLGTVKAVSK